MKRLFLSVAILTLLLEPLAIFAQTSGIPIAPTPPPNTTAPISPITRPSSTAPASRFTPGAQNANGSENTFSGLSFSGVGGALLGCENIGKSIVSNVGNLFKKAAEKAKEVAASAATAGADSPAASGGGTGGEQPVTDAKVTEEMKKQTKRENCLNGMANAVAKKMLEQVSTKTIRWINTGFEGNPLYVRDIDSYLKTIRDDKLQQYLQNVPSSNPIFGNALRSVIQTQVTGFNDGQLNKTMNTPEARSYQAFLDDFTQGGWDKWLQTTQIDSNNPIGALFQASDQLSSQIQNAQQNVKDQLLQGNGFLNMQKCVEYEKPSLTSSINQNAGFSSLCATITPQNQAYCQSNAALASAGAAPRCLRYETVTPGSIIAQQAAYITNSPVRQLEYADKINEVLGSFFSEMLSRLFTGGLAGLSGRGAGTSFGMGSNVVIGTDGMPIASQVTSAQDLFGYQQINGGYNGEFDISRPQQLRAVLKSQMDYLNRTQDSRAMMSRIVPILGALDYCLPGPNPTWKVGTNYNMQLFTAALQGKPPSKTLGNTISSISSLGGAAASVGVVTAPIGAIIAVVGNVVGQLVNLAGGDNPISIEAKGLQLFDKVTNGAQGVSSFSMNRARYFDNISLIDYLQDSYNEMMEIYKKEFSPEKITSAFVATNPSNATHIKARINEIMSETTNMVYYNQSLLAYGKQYDESIATAEDAVLALKTIDEEVEKIVATAKARYIEQQKNAGTPVNMKCIDQAYNVNTAPIPSVKREIDPNAPLDPRVERSRKASDYFYNHL